MKSPIVKLGESLRPVLLSAGLLLLLSVSTTASAQATKTPPVARIKSVSTSTCTIDKGSKAGYRRGMVVDVYSAAKVVNLPLTGKDEPIYVTQKVIARLVVLSVNSDSAVGEILGKPSKTITSGNVVLFNPTFKPKNERPYLRNLLPVNSKKKPVAANWRERVTLSLTVDNEPSDDLYFRWNSQLLTLHEKSTDTLREQGILTAPRTKLARNTWICPSTKGLYRVDVVAYDSSGATAKASFYLKSLGIQKKVLNRVKYKGLAYDENLVAGVRDVAVDLDGSLAFLVGSSGSFLGGSSLSVKVLSEAGEISGTYKLKDSHSGAIRMAASSKAVYLLDAKAYKVKRFERRNGKNIGATLAAGPRQFGERGVGNGKFSKPVDLALLASGDVAVLDEQNAAIQVFSELGVFLYSVGMKGPGKGQMKRPVALTASPSGSLYCLDAGRRVVLQFDNGQYSREFSVTASGTVTGLSFDPFTGMIGVADTGARTLVRVNPELGRTVSSSIGGPFQPIFKEILELKSCSVVRHDGHSNFLVIDREGKSVVRYSAQDSKRPGPNGFAGRLGGVEVGDGLKVAASVNGELGILNPSSKKAYRFDRQGWLRVICGGDNPKGYRLNSPIDIAFGSQGNMYLLDAGVSRVLPIDKTGKVLPMIGVAGEGESQLTDCIDMECSGRRRSLIILQERNNNNFHSLSFQGVGQSMARNLGMDTPVVACVDVDGKFWTIDDDVLGTKAPLRSYSQEDTHEFDEITDIAASIDNAVYLVDYGDYFIQVMETNSRSGRSIKRGEIKMKQISKPKDIGLDNYGRFYVYDDSTEKVHRLSD